MHRLLLLVLIALSLACAAPEHTTYSQAALRPPFPTPPSTPAGTGALVVGQPGQQASKPPRSPHVRPLPPSAEPGLWAGDAPRASRSRKPGPPELLGVTLPFVSADPLEEEEAPTRYCADEMKKSFDSLFGPKDLAVLTLAQQRCLAAQLYAACTAELLHLYERTRDRETMLASTPRVHRLHITVTEVAERFQREACDGVLPHIHARNMLKKTFAKWKSEF